MKQSRSLAFVLLTGLLFTACGGSNDYTPPVFQSFTATPTTVSAAGSVNMAASVTDDSGTIRQVAFYRGTTLVATDTTAPYTATDNLTAAQNGTYDYYAVATDDAGNSATSSKVPVTVKIDANEPNDSVAGATPLTIGTPINGTIAGQPRDMDYFKFTAAAGDMLKLTVKSVSVDPNSTLDPYVMILMPDGKTVLEKDDDSGTGLESEIRFNVPAAGTYTAVVTSFNIHDDVTGKVTDDKITNTYQIALTKR